jgi:hypothetical protein
MDIRAQAIAGLTPPELGEARIREAFPSVARFGGVASLGRKLTGTIILAPLAWLIMAPLYFGKVLFIWMRRYTLTNRRLMIRKGWGGKIVGEVPLDRIDDIRLVTDANSAFFRAGNLEIITQGQVVLTLAGVPEPDSFRHAIVNACTAWVPGKSKSLPFIAASAVK